MTEQKPSIGRTVYEMFAPIRERHVRSQTWTFLNGVSCVLVRDKVGWVLTILPENPPPGWEPKIFQSPSRSRAMTYVRAMARLTFSDHEAMGVVFDFKGVK